MKLISLTQKRVAKVDDEDYEYLKKNKWCVYKSTHGKYYAMRNSSRKSLGGKYSIKMHREILGLERNDGLFADHINGDTLDNQKRNLRIVTARQNAFNRGAQMNNKSGFKGVYKHAQYDKWVSQIKFGKKRKHLGVFETKFEAAKAYKNASKKYHGIYGKV